MSQSKWFWVLVLLTGCGGLWWVSDFLLHLGQGIDQKMEMSSQGGEEKGTVDGQPSAFEVDFRVDTRIQNERESVHQLRVRDLGVAEGEDRLEKLGSPLVQGKVPFGWRVEADAEESVELEHEKLRVRSPIYRLAADPKIKHLFFHEPGVVEGMNAAPLLLADAAMLRTHANRWKFILAKMREVIPSVHSTLQGEAEGYEKSNHESRRDRSKSNR